jgi:hypothetical protein
MLFSTTILCLSSRITRSVRLSYLSSLEHVWDISISKCLSCSEAGDSDPKHNLSADESKAEQAGFVLCSLPDKEVSIMIFQGLKSVVAHYARRLKCDRQVPCATCANNGIGPSCHYAARPTNGSERRDDGLRNSEAHLRLQKLEEMVTSLMQKTGAGFEGSKSNTNPSNGTIEQSIGSLSVDSSPYPFNRTSNGHLDYQGGTHWSAILENVGFSPKMFVCFSLTDFRFGIFKVFSNLNQTPSRSQFNSMLQMLQNVQISQSTQIGL